MTDGVTVQGVLTQVSRPTKSTLNRLGVFTVSSLHAYICARSPSLLNNLLAGRGATKRRAPMLARTNSASGRRSLQGSGMNIESDKHVQLTLPDHQLVTVFLRDAMTVEEFLAAGCIKKGLSPVEHFIRVKKRRDMPTMNYFVPHRSDLIETYVSPALPLALITNSLCCSSQLTRWWRSAARSSTRWSWPGTLSTPCGASRWRLSSWRTTRSR